MRDLIIVAKFTAQEMIKRKSFLVSNLIILLLIVIGFNVPNIMNLFNKDTSSEETGDTIIVMDQEKIFGDSLSTLNNMELGKKFEINPEANVEEVKEKINAGEIKAAILISKEENNVGVEYITDSLGMTDSGSQYEQIINELYKSVKLSQLGLTQDKITEISQPIDMKVTELKEGTSGANLFLIMMLIILLFFAIYFCAYQVSSSITTEKTSKIMETLVTSTKPTIIVLGKTLGIGLVGLLQIIAIVVVAVFSYKVFLPTGVLDGILDLSKVTPLFIGMTLIYFILGYSLYALLYALTGSTVSKPEDISSANSPIAMLAMVGFYLAYFSMMNPTSGINIFASIFPFSSPFSMPLRIMGGMASVTEIIISLIVLLVTILIVARIAIKIYSSAILNYGTKIGLKDMFKIYKDKNN